MTKLKQCPFCGEAPTLREAEYDPDTNEQVAPEYVECKECGAIGPFDLGGKDGVEAWNERAENVA